ncbi:MAG TPA: hypothetical protein VGE99_01500 [Candidatus Dormibacteraeota bacterium]
MVEAVAVFVAWLGTSIVVLADGRRGLALGAVLAATGIGVIAFDRAGALAAVAVGAGALIGAAGRLRSGNPGWHIMPAGSTPRLVLCLAAALIALWVGAAVTSGPGGALRFTAMLVIGLSGARMVGGEGAPVLLTASGLMAFGIALASTLGGGTLEPWPFLAAGILAAGVGWISPRTLRAT